MARARKGLTSDPLMREGEREYRMSSSRSEQQLVGA